jgi:circadian clock protein KaiC
MERCNLAKDAVSPRRVSTGIAGLDDVLDGGFPPDRLYLIQGDPGTGKTTMALQFLMDGIRRGERVLFIALSETKDELETVAGSHGWNLDGINVFELSAAQQNRPGEQNTLFLPSEVELNEITQVLLQQVERVKPTRVVIDSLSELRLLSQSPLRFRRQILALKQHFVGKGVTVLMLDDIISGGEEAQAHTVAHGVMELQQMVPEYGAERRRLRLLKLRGVKYRGGWHDYAIVTGGLAIYPRLIAAEHKLEFKTQPFPSGIKELDDLLGGGIDRGTSMLIMGPAGSGKTSIGLQFASAAIGRAERAVIFMFDENQQTLLTRAQGIGLNLRDAVQEGRLMLRQVDPAEMSPGEFTSLVREAVQKDGAKLVIIDSLNGFMNSMPEERFLTIHMHEMLTYLSQQGVLSIVVMAQHGIMGKMESPIDVSYLSDAVLLLRYFESHGSIHQAVSVMKKRTGRHERTIREFRITAEGIRVGEPLQDFHGVLTGVPTYSGSTLPKLGLKI